ncbi:hypothetical protein PV04_02181 [Phialophora macrospora]|uniref:Uncharacterized protein n=1 Tax=Phialophora macrospora TaxID=1851006 RepID=A0A0D2FNN2_9EURO|nr:hypothetical protein PV04_02181 [Phialophora macrospora]
MSLLRLIYSRPAQIYLTVLCSICRPLWPLHVPGFCVGPGVETGVGASDVRYFHLVRGSTGGNTYHYCWRSPSAEFVRSGLAASDSASCVRRQHETDLYVTICVGVEA